MQNNIENKLKIFFLSKYKDAVQDQEGKFTSYLTIREEYNSLKNGVGIRDISHFGILKLTGTDVLEFLNRISTNDTRNLEVFHKVETLFTNEKGRIIDRTTLLRFDNDFLLIGSALPVAKLHSWINRYIVTEDIQIEPVNERWTLLEVSGPQAASYMTLLCGDTLNLLKDDNVLTVDLENLKFFFFGKNGVTILKKYWILTYSIIADKLVEYLLGHKSVFDLSMIGENAYNMFRIEKGLPDSPNEINDSFNPYEANLLDEVNFSKGCYIGQEVLARLDTYDKVQRKLVGVIFEKDINPDGKLKIVDNDNNEIGTVTSTVKSEPLNKMVGLAYIRKTVPSNNNKFFAVNDNAHYDVKLTDLPFQL